MNSPFTRTLVSLIVFLVVSYAAAVPASAQQRFIVRTAAQATISTGPLTGLQVLSGPQIIARACATLGCTVRYPLDNAVPSQLFLITASDLANPLLFTSVLPTLPGILHVETDDVLQTLSGTAGTAPPALLNAEPVDFYGVTVRAGYPQQPANTILGISAARAQHGLTGSGIIVAVIDTGVDPTHPVLSPVLLQGYDYTRNRTGASELGDVNDSMMYAVDTAQPAQVNESTMAIVNDSMMYAVDDPNHAAFGHGTMVAGVIHLVAPLATILPLKAFGADGKGYKSDVLRAIYGAVSQGVKILNMSFSFTNPSDEMRNALNYAMESGVVPVASAGNGGQMKIVYPAALPGVIGVASTTNNDVLSSFSNFGAQVAWIAAPGEGVVTTYPLGTYAAAWGTSFSTPFAAGAAALLAEADGGVNALDAKDAEGYSIWIGPQVNKGRLDIPSAIQAFITRLNSQQPSAPPPDESTAPPSPW